jgi:hypothetical protein
MAAGGESIEGYLFKLGKWVHGENNYLLESQEQQH